MPVTSQSNLEQSPEVSPVIFSNMQLAIFPSTTKLASFLFLRWWQIMNFNLCPRTAKKKTLKSHCKRWTVGRGKKKNWTFAFAESQPKSKKGKFTQFSFSLLIKKSYSYSLLRFFIKFMQIFLATWQIGCRSSNNCHSQGTNQNWFISKRIDRTSRCEHKGSENIATRLCLRAGSAAERRDHCRWYLNLCRALWD